MNKELIAQMREAIDNMDDYARMADIKATGPLAVLSRGAEALEELERKLDVAREALEKISSPTQVTALLWWQIEAREALAQIGGDDAAS